MDYETKMLMKDYEDYQKTNKTNLNETKTMKDALETIASFEDNLNDLHTEYTLLKCFAIAKEALLKCKK